MKTLLLMRHAKSSWKDPKLADFDRPLNKRGKKDAPLMGRFLLSIDMVPQHVLCSAANRAVATTKAVTENCKYKGVVEYSKALYMADPTTLIEYLRQVDNQHHRLLLVNHNPALESLLHYLSREIEAMPTAAVAHIALPIKKWKSLELDTLGQLENLWKPRDFK
jgi:phosphohistidine phosphatase